MVNIFEVYTNLKQKESCSVSETAFINTMDNIAKQYRINKSPDINQILENHNDFLMNLIIARKDSDFTLHALLTEGFREKEITPESIESFYNDHINYTKTQESIRSMDSIIGHEVKSLNKEKFELSEKDFITKLDNTLSKLEERKRNFLNSMDIRSEESRSTILAELDQKVYSSYMEYCNRMIEEFPESEKIINKINNFIGTEEYQQIFDKMNSSSKKNDYISPIIVFTQSSEYLKAKESEKKAFALANSPTGELLYTYKEKNSVDKAKIKKSSNFILSSTKRDIDEIDSSKYEPEVLLRSFLNKINAYNRQEYHEAIRNAYQDYSKALIDKHPKIKETATKVSEYINSDSFKNARDIDIINASKEYTKNQELLKGSLDIAKEELDKAVPSLSPPPLLSKPNEKFAPVIPKGGAAVMRNLGTLIESLEKKKGSILAKVEKEHQETMSAELDKQIESLYEARKNELSIEPTNTPIIDRIDKIVDLEENKLRTKHEIINSFKIKYDAEQKIANKHQLEMAKKAKELLTEALKNYIVDKNNKKDTTIDGVNAMLNSQNSLLDSNHQIKLSDIEQKATELATKEIQKSRSKLTGMIQRLKGTSSASNVKKIMKKLNSNEYKAPTTSHRGPMGLAKKLISKVVRGARQ